MVTWQVNIDEQTVFDFYCSEIVFRFIEGRLKIRKTLITMQAVPAEGLPLESRAKVVKTKFALLLRRELILTAERRCY